MFSNGWCLHAGDDPPSGARLRLDARGCRWHTSVATTQRYTASQARRCARCQRPPHTGRGAHLVDPASRPSFRFVASLDELSLHQVSIRCPRSGRTTGQAHSARQTSRRALARISAATRNHDANVLLLLHCRGMIVIQQTSSNGRKTAAHHLPQRRRQPGHTRQEPLRLGPTSTAPPSIGCRAK
jgi:hypothetical protein